MGGDSDHTPRDRRANNRAAIEIPAVLHLDGQEHPCTIRDLSSAGMALSHKGEAALDSEVRVVFRLPNVRQPIDVAGVLLRREGGLRAATLGLRFLAPSEGVIVAIETFVSRNRTDLPFSRPGADGGLGAGSPGELDRSLRGLYARAVSNESQRDKAPRRGLFGRWRRQSET